jgi:hypothetical protein
MGEDKASGLPSDLARLLLTDHRHALATIVTLTSASGSTHRALLANLVRQYYGKLVKECGVRAGPQAGGWRTSVRAQLHPPMHLKDLQNDHHRERPAARAEQLGHQGGRNWGVSQVLSRYSYLATLYLRRVSTSIDKNSKLIQPRKLHGSQFGVLAERPKAHRVVVKELLLAGFRDRGNRNPTVAMRGDPASLIAFDYARIRPETARRVNSSSMVVEPTTVTLSLRSCRERKRSGYYTTTVVRDALSGS